MLAVIKYVVDGSIICLSATQRGVHDTVQQLLCKTLNLISPELWFQLFRAELNWLQDVDSLQQREYELQVNKIEEIKQWLVEL